jgi:signal transduction histidine kinase
VRVQVADDGQGFNEATDAVGEAGHYGLATMRERAQLAGGWLRVHADRGRGTTIEAWIPHLAADPHERDTAVGQERQ